MVETLWAFSFRLQGICLTYRLARLQACSASSICPEYAEQESPDGPARSVYGVDARNSGHDCPPSGADSRATNYANPLRITRSSGCRCGTGRSSGSGQHDDRIVRFPSFARSHRRKLRLKFEASHRRVENRLNLFLRRHPRVGEPTCILHRVGRQCRDVIGLGAQLGQAAGDADVG